MIVPIIIIIVLKIIILCTIYILQVFRFKEIPILCPPIWSTISIIIYQLLLISYYTVKCIHRKNYEALNTYFHVYISKC